MHALEAGRHRCSSYSPPPPPLQLLSAATASLLSSQPTPHAGSPWRRGLRAGRCSLLAPLAAAVRLGVRCCSAADTGWRQKVSWRAACRRSNCSDVKLAPVAIKSDLHVRVCCVRIQPESISSVGLKLACTCVLSDTAATRHFVEQLGRGGGVREGMQDAGLGRECASVWRGVLGYGVL